MREIIIEPYTEDAIIELCDFVESKNTTGSGERFYKRLLDFIESYATLTNLKFPLCQNKNFAARKWSCLIFKDKWVIAFSYSENKMTIHRFVLGSKLK